MEFVQVGITALRDPKTREFLPSVPLYVRSEDADSPAMVGFADDIVKIFAQKFKEYVEGTND